MTERQGPHISTHIYKRCHWCPENNECPLQLIQDSTYENRDALWHSESATSGKVAIRSYEVLCRVKQETGRMRISE
jgi:hypothetical protein